MLKADDKTVLTKKSQITLPKRIRDFLKLKPGDQVRLVIEDNEVKIVPIRSKLEENFGKVAPRRKPEDFKKIRETVENEIAKEVLKEF